MGIEDIENRIIELNKLKKFIKKNQIQKNDSLEEIIFKKYLELENVNNVSKYINELGYRVKTDKGERVYSSNDISSILLDKKVNVKSELREFVYKLFVKHKKGSRH